MDAARFDDDEYPDQRQDGQDTSYTGGGTHGDTDEDVGGIVGARLHSGTLGPLPSDWRWALLPDQQTDILPPPDSYGSDSGPDGGMSGGMSGSLSEGPPPPDLARLDALHIPRAYDLGGYGLDPGEEVGSDAGPPLTPPSPPLPPTTTDGLPPLDADTQLRRLWSLSRDGMRGHARDAYTRGDRAEPPAVPGGAGRGTPLPAGRRAAAPDSGPLHRRLAGRLGAHTGRTDTPVAHGMGRAAPRTTPLSGHAPSVAFVSPPSLSPSPGFALRQREEARMAQINWMVRDHNTAMASAIRILPFLRLTLQFPITARTAAFSPGIKPIYEPQMAWYMLAQLFPRLNRPTDRMPRESDLALSAHLWPPSISYAEIARTAILPDTRAGWGMGAYVESDPVLRLIVAAAWLRLYAQRELVAAALNIAPANLYDIPASAGRWWRPDAPQACYFGPITQHTWYDWHARYYTALWRLLGNLLCGEAQLVPQTAEYLACADRAVPPPGPDRYAAVLAHHQRMHPHWQPDVGWYDYIAYLAERNRVPRLLVLSRLYPAPWERGAGRGDGQQLPRMHRQSFAGWWRIGEREHYRQLMRELVDESANLSHWRAQVAEHKRVGVDDITLWLMEPLSLVPTFGREH